MIFAEMLARLLGAVVVAILAGLMLRALSG